MPETRALLLTDLVDSTKLADQLGDVAMAELWTRHDRVARDLLVAHGGREIDKTDGFLLLFETSAQAVAYALAYHRAIRDLGVQARAGIHTGPVILTENATADVARGAKPLEVDGLAKPTAARVMGLAIGGQTLLTAEAKAALGPTEPRLESHGFWRMKGVSEPVELFEVGGPDAPFTPPPDGAKVYRVVRQGDLWLPVGQVKHNLPTERDAFVGRQSDLHDLARLLDDGAHLVSVLGIGGTGKTRLVTRFAWTWLGDWPGGAWFCDLSEARDVDGIASAVARALDVPLGKDDPLTQLGHAIAGRGKCLMILDNFEQLTRHAPQVLGVWLDRASEARFVVTTREILGLPGETALALAPLNPGDAVDLFVARALQAKRDFTLAADERPAVTELVRLLDALPLAIELAAARVRVMPPKTLLQRMSERFRLLASSGGRHTRQATLRAALDWSWDLLSADEQAALAQLSVFEGGFGLEAAEGVLVLDALWPMDAVQALVDKSLVRPVGEGRFDLLVSVQEYAAEKLAAAGGREDAEARHGDGFARFGTDDAIDQLHTHGGVARFQELARDLENLVVACRRAANRGSGANAVALLRAAWRVLERTGPAARGLDLADLVTAMAGLSVRDATQARLVRGEALHLVGRADEARADHEAAVAAAREIGDRRLACDALARLGGLHRDQGRTDDARRTYEAALTIARELGDRRREGMVLGSLGMLRFHRGQPAEALEGLGTALAIAREVGDRRAEGIWLANLATVHLEQGRMDEARRCFEAALAVAREVGDRRTEGPLLRGLGMLELDQGRLDEARAQLDAAVRLTREVGIRRAEGVAQLALGILHAQQGRMDSALAQFEGALAIQREVGDRSTESVTLGNLGNVRVREGRMDEGRAHFEAALAIAREVGDRRGEGAWLGLLGQLCRDQGRRIEARGHFRDGERLLREVGDCLQLALLLCGRVPLDVVDGDLEAARAALAEAEALAEALNAGGRSDVGEALVSARIALEAC